MKRCDFTKREEDWDGIYGHDIELYQCECKTCLTDNYDKPTLILPLNWGEWDGSVLFNEDYFGHWEVTAPWTIAEPDLFLSKCICSQACIGNFMHADRKVWPLQYSESMHILWGWPFNQIFETLEEAVRAVEAFHEAVLAVYELADNEVAVRSLRTFLDDDLDLVEAVACTKAVL